MMVMIIIITIELIMITMISMMVMIIIITIEKLNNITRINCSDIKYNVNNDDNYIFNSDNINDNNLFQKVIYHNNKNTAQLMSLIFN